MSKWLGGFHPIFLLFACVMIYFGNGWLFFNYFIVIIIHEFGHAVVAKRLGYKLKDFCLMPYGAQLNLQTNALRFKDEIMIALAGPLVNIFLGGVFIALWWIFPIIYSYTEYFVIANVIMAGFNLLPLVPLDGSRILLAILGKYNKRQKGYKVLSWFNCVTGFGLFVLFIVTVFHEINYTFGILAILLIVGAFERNSDFDYCHLFQIEKFELNKKRSLPIRFFAVDIDYKAAELIKLINPSYYTVVIILDNNFKPIKTIFESDFEKLLVKSL